LAAESASPGSATLLKLVFVGLFFNQVLPTGVGGDAVRRCSRLGVGLGDAIRSILLDPACGYLVLIVLYVLALPNLFKILPGPAGAITVVSVLVVGLAGLAALVSLD
jgi:glycosyltransferase 2 family protein